MQRALAKRPDDRYQHVGDLVDDLTIAAGMEAATTPPVPTSVCQRHRIVVPTHSTAERALAEPDEETAVRPRVEHESGANVAPRTNEMYAASPAANLNLWKILIPSLAGLLLVFAVVYAFTRDSDAGEQQSVSTGTCCGSEQSGSRTFTSGYRKI